MKNKNPYEKALSAIAIDLDLRATLRRCDPPLGDSLLLMAVEIVREGMLLGYCGHAEIHPGMAKLAKWGKCSERQARRNIRELECWELAIPASFVKGGKHSTGYAIDPEAIIRIAQELGANPTVDLVTKLNVHLDAISDHINAKIVINAKMVKTTSEVVVKFKKYLKDASPSSSRPDICPPVLKGERSVENLKRSADWCEAQSPDQEVGTDAVTPVNRRLMALDGEYEPIDTGEIAGAVHQTSQQPAQSLDGSNAAAAYMRGIRLEARRRKLQDAELQRIRFAVAEVWSEYAATDDLNDPRAWA
jgi:hypothetical protein